MEKKILEILKKHEFSYISNEEEIETGDFKKEVGKAIYYDINEKTFEDSEFIILKNLGKGNAILNLILLYYKIERDDLKNIIKENVVNLLKYNKRSIEFSKNFSKNFIWAVYLNRLAKEESINVDVYISYFTQELYKTNSILSYLEILNDEDLDNLNFNSDIFKSFTNPLYDYYSNLEYKSVEKIMPLVSKERYNERALFTLIEMQKDYMKNRGRNKKILFTINVYEGFKNLIKNNNYEKVLNQLDNVINWVLKNSFKSKHFSVEDIQTRKNVFDPENVVNEYFNINEVNKMDDEVIEKLAESYFFNYYILFFGIDSLYLFKRDIFKYTDPINKFYTCIYDLIEDNFALGLKEYFIRNLVKKQKDEELNEYGKIKTLIRNSKGQIKKIAMNETINKTFR